MLAGQTLRLGTRSAEQTFQMHSEVLKTLAHQTASNSFALIYDLCCSQNAEFRFFFSLFIDDIVHPYISCVHCFP